MMLLEHVVANHGWLGIGSLTSEPETWTTRYRAEVGRAFYGAWKTRAALVATTLVTRVSGCHGVMQTDCEKFSRCY